MGSASAKASKTDGKTSGNSQQTNELNDWSKTQFQNQQTGILDTINNYNATSPYKAYTGETVAGMTPDQVRARQLANQNVGSQDGILGQSQDAYNRGLAYDPSNVSQYYNPYEQDVVDASGAYMDENLQKSIAQNQARATQSGAYGGSRHGVADAELERTSNMDKAKMMSDLRYKGYGDAQNVGFQNQQAQFQDAAGLQGLAGASKGLQQADVSQLEQLGATQREIEQARVLADKAEFDQESAERYRRFLVELQSRQGILNSTPMVTNTGVVNNSKSSSTDVGVSGTVGIF